MLPPASLTGARWTLLPVDERRLAALHTSGLPPVVARIMAQRGMDADGGWLTPSWDHLHDAYDMANMDLAVERLKRAAAAGERLRVITDYDVDGTTSSLVLQAALSLTAPHLQLDYHIPDRFAEGYGFSELAARRAAADGIGVIVTADIGVRDHASVTAARAAGVDVLVCDHHLPPGADVPPDATVLCPPQEACSYPNRHLAACGVSFKLASALLADHPRRDVVLRSLLKLVAIGTVSDMVPLNTLENRALVRLGLDELNSGKHSAGLTALLDVAGAKPGEIDEGTVGYQLGPRINAAGRLAKATHVVELLTERDPGRARVLAGELDAINRERRDVQASLVDKVIAALPAEPDPFVLVSGPEEGGFHRGVVGIVAAKVKEKVHRPVAVVSIQGERAVGSVRSIPGVHAVRALDSVADLLVKYGGHPAAAGFSVATHHLPALRERLSAYVAAHVDEDTLVEEHAIDAEVRPEELSTALHAALRRLGPFGAGNPEPRLLLRGVVLDDLRTIGSDGRHLKGRLRSAGGRLDVLWWGRADLAGQLQGTPVDLLVTLGVSVWRGVRSLQLVVADARLTAA